MTRSARLVGPPRWGFAAAAAAAAGRTVLPSPFAALPLLPLLPPLRPLAGSPAVSWTSVLLRPAGPLSCAVCGAAEWPFYCGPLRPPTIRLLSALLLRCCWRLPAAPREAEIRPTGATHLP